MTQEMYFLYYGDRHGFDEQIKGSYKSKDEAIADAGDIGQVIALQEGKLVVVLELCGDEWRSPEDCDAYLEKLHLQKMALRETAEWQTIRRLGEKLHYEDDSGKVVAYEHIDNGCIFNVNYRHGRIDGVTYIEGDDITIGLSDLRIMIALKYDEKGNLSGDVTFYDFESLFSPVNVKAENMVRFVKYIYVHGNLSHSELSDPVVLRQAWITFVEDKGLSE